MRHILIFVTTLLILSSCQTNDLSRSETFQVLLPDTSKTHRPNFLFNILIAYGEQMHLPRIDTGSNNFELRIWTNSMIDPDQMVLVRKFGTTVLGQKFDYNSSFDSLEYYKLSDTYQNIALTQFVDSVQKIDFTKMLSQNEIENFEDNIADGITYHLEISTPIFISSLLTIALSVSPKQIYIIKDFLT